MTLSTSQGAQQGNVKPNQAARRIASIDTIRFVANFSVIISHWFNWYGPNGTFLYISFYYFLGNIVHFAVPYFFILSGYFIRHSLGGGKRGYKIAYRYSTRIAPIYIFWILVYALVPGRVCAPCGLRVLRR